MPKPFTGTFAVPPTLHPDYVGINPSTGKPVNHYTVTEKSALQEIAPGIKTPILGYISRNGTPAMAHEAGPKDVVYVGEGEKVTVIMRFEKNTGRYMIHCHNLPHEDHDMMLQYSVGLKKGDPDPNDPMRAAPPVWDTPAPA